MNKKKQIIAAAIAVLAGIIYFTFGRAHQDTKETTREVSPFYGSIQNSVSATGNIQPQNRLAIKPPIGGRIEKILVEEGQMVKAGDILVLMSSTERAALLDAARLQGAEAIKQWEDVYKPTTLIAPIDGQIIVKTVNPGQTVTQSDDVVVISDRLIVQAQVDETDIGKVKLGQQASISLDAYPDIQVNGKVDHIYYESKIVNNVTIYAVDIVPDSVPDVFRSGMTANVQIMQERKDHVLLLPREAVKKRRDKNTVLVKQNGGKGERQEVEVGLADDVNVEILSGVGPDDKILIVTQKYTAPSAARTSSPFMPGGGQRGNGGQRNR